MLELKRDDWTTLAAQGSASAVPQAIADLLSAKTVEQAEEAYWRIDNTVVVQGKLFEAAVPTLRLVLTSIHQCAAVARPLALELLVQLASGSNEPADDGTLARQCRRELVYELSYVFSLVEHGALEERMHCVDLLGLCVHADRTLLPRVRWYFEELVRQKCPEQLGKLIRSTLEDLTSIDP
ncbi:MAG: hypothetical protein MJE77_08720 [Proteobacteria bacterium]|nr:hypothetical protein [Pseudomonadota bacterium]